LTDLDKEGGMNFHPDFRLAVLPIRPDEFLNLVMVAHKEEFEFRGS